MECSSDLGGAIGFCNREPKNGALAIFARTLEIFDMAGVVAPLPETANRVTSVAVMAQEASP